MSSEQLKMSLRHTHAYIEAYGVELLEDVEKLFRHALGQVDEGAATSMQTDVIINAETTSASAAPPAFQPQTAPSRHEPNHVKQETALETLANWHFYMPAIIAGVAVTAILFRGWFS